MELSAVLSLRDKLSAKMEKASKSVSAMTARVNESREAIAKISATQNIRISASSNIAETVATGRASITSLQNTISEKELALQTKLELDGFESETIQEKLNQLSGYLNKNAGKIEEYNNKLAILKQKQNEFTDSTKGSVKLGIEQSIDSLQQKLADIENAKKEFAQWQQIRLDFNELEVARSELSTLEQAIENINGTNIAVRAYIDFKKDALKQVYDIDEKLKSIGKKIVNPIIHLKDQASEKISHIKNQAKRLAQEKFSPIVSVIDQANSVISSVKTGLAKVAGTIAYPIIKLKDIASVAVNNVKSKLESLKNKIFTPELKLKAEQAFRTIKELGSKIADLGSKAGKAVVSATSKIGKGLALSIGLATTAVSGIGASAISVGAQFEASMSQVAATMGMTAEEANYSNDTYALLANTAKKMGASTKFSASESAEALNYLALAGYDAVKATDALPTILNLAQAGGMDLAAASDMVTDSMSALGIEATNKNLTEFGDKLAKASQKSNTSVSQLGDAILTVGGTAKRLAGGTTEMSTALGILADSGIKASEGGTALRNVINAMTPTTDDAVNAFKSLGIETYDAEGKLRSLNDIFTDLNKELSERSNEQQDYILSDIFNKTDLKSASALMAATATTTNQLKTALSAADVDVDKLGVSLDSLVSSFNKTQSQEEFVASAMKQFGLDSEQAGVMYTGLMSVVDGSATRWNELSGYIDDSNGAMAAMAETMNDNLQGRITEFNSAMESVKVAIYEALGSSNLKDLVAEASGWIGELTEATEKGGIDGLVGAVGGVFAKVVAKITSLAPQIIQAGVNLIGSLINGVKSNFPAIVDGLSNTGSVFVEGIFQLIPQVLLAGGDLAMQLAKGVTQQLPTLLESGVESVEQLAQGISNGLPMAIDVGVKLITTLSNGITKSMPRLLPAIIKIITSLTTALTQNLNPILTASLNILLALMQGLIEALPVIIPAVLQILLGIVQFMTENIGVILEAAMTIIMGLVQGLVEALPVLMPAVLELLFAIVQFIIENLDTIISAAINILMALVQGIVESIPVLIPAIVEVIMNIVQFISDNLPMILEAALNIILALIQGIVDNIPMLVDGVIQVITGLVTFITENLPMIIEVAIQIVVALIQGLIQAIPQLVEGALSLVDSIWDTIINTNWLQLGVDLIKGIGEGLVEGVKSIGSTIGNVASSIVDKFKGFLGIHSPSTVMKAEVGFHMGTGVAEGLKETKSLINKEIKNMTDDMILSLDSNIKPAYKESDFKVINAVKDTKNGAGVIVESQIKNNFDEMFGQQLQELEQGKNKTKSNYDSLEIAKNTQQTKNVTTTTTNNKTNNNSEKKIYIEKLIEKVIVNNERDEDRLVKKILKALAEDIEETATNM